MLVPAVSPLAVLDVRSLQQGTKDPLVRTADPAGQAPISHRLNPCMMRVGEAMDTPGECVLVAVVVVSESEVQALVGLPEAAVEGQVQVG